MESKAKQPKLEEHAAVEQKPKVEDNNIRILLNIIKELARLRIEGSKLTTLLETIKFVLDAKSINDPADIRKHHETQVLLQYNQRKIAQLECIFANTKQAFFMSMNK